MDRYVEVYTIELSLPTDKEPLTEREIQLAVYRDVARVDTPDAIEVRKELF